jgi:hypothetical protein
MVICIYSDLYGVVVNQLVETSESRSDDRVLELDFYLCGWVCLQARSHLIGVVHGAERRNKQNTDIV